jgi:hypothetical protein
MLSQLPIKMKTSTAERSPLGSGTCSVSLDSSDYEHLIVDVMRYQTTDGESHSTKSSAAYHQKEIALTDHANARLEAGDTIADILRAVGKSVPDPILEKVTKDSKLAIPHWQCRDEAGYTPRRFEHGAWTVYVYGRAGSWSGGYGNTMSVQDLARYATDRKSILSPNA